MKLIFFASPDLRCFDDLIFFVAIVYSLIPCFVLAAFCGHIFRFGIFPLAALVAGLVWMWRITIDVWTPVRCLLFFCTYLFLNFAFFAPLFALIVAPLALITLLFCIGLFPHNQMNSDTLPSLPAVPLPQPPTRLLRLIMSLVLVATVFDFCYWKWLAAPNELQPLYLPGLPTALFFSALAVITLANRERLKWRSTTLLLLGLTAGAAFAAVIETGFSNQIVFFVLAALLAGDTFFGDTKQPWGRWLAQAVALIRAPGRVFWLALALTRSSVPVAGRDGAIGWGNRLFFAGLLALPALVLALIFGWLLADGNAVFGQWTGQIFDWLWQALIHFDPTRLFLWFFVAFLALPLLRPVAVSDWWWSWALRLPLLPEIIPLPAALFSSSLILVLLNLLFLAANIADALFLWSGAPLPNGVTYSAFVHHGVEALIFTVILSAFVLTAVFQQPHDVTRWRGLKILGLFWVAQNLFLLLSVALRLKLYIEAYDMTVLRLGVLLFLLLVAAGYALLAVKIARDKSLSWLVGGCAIAIFFTFYLTQFLDLGGWSANYNVAQWEKNRTRNLDITYLVELGPSAWPALRRVHELQPNDPSLAGVLSDAQQNEKDHPQARIDSGHWREFSLRAWLNRDALRDRVHPAAS